MGIELTYSEIFENLYNLYNALKVWLVKIVKKSGKRHEDTKLFCLAMRLTLRIRKICPHGKKRKSLQSLQRSKSLTCKDCKEINKKNKKILKITTKKIYMYTTYLLIELFNEFIRSHNLEEEKLR